MKRSTATILTPIVLRALASPVTDIGQLTRAEKLELERAVRSGILAKGQGGAFPILKTVYAVVGHDFAAERASWIAYWKQLAGLDRARLGPNAWTEMKFQEAAEAAEH